MSQGTKNLFAIFFVMISLFIAIAIYYDSNEDRTSATEEMLPDASVLRNTDKNESTEIAEEAAKNDAVFDIPLDKAAQRVTKKKFGQFITPQNSPVQPEKFSGYHTGADYEVFPDELEKKVSVQAVCGGKIIQKSTAGGYGGVLVQACELEGSPVTVVYGHLQLASIAKKIGEVLEGGEPIGYLGAHKSFNTDGERKHLHLGIHKGASVNIRGYVSAKAELQNWIDPCSQYCR